jgi:hypothetical protein
MNVLSDISNTDSEVSVCESKTCCLNCNNKLDKDSFKELQKHLCNKLDNKGRKEYILFHVKRENLSSNSVQKFIWKYTLENHEVCKHVFLKALNKSDSYVKYIFDQNDKEMNNEKTETKHWKQHTDEFNKSISDFIMSFKPQNSHYSREKCPNRLYIDDSYRLYPSKLYRKFAEYMKFVPRFNVNETQINKKNDNLSICNFRYFEQYRIKTLNVGFSQLSNDKCKECKVYYIHENSAEQCDIDCEICLGFAQHVEYYESARKSMNRDAETAENSSDTLVVSCDAQKMISIPQLETQDCYFTSRIQALNLTFCGIKSNSKSYCFISNDTQIEKNSSEHINFILMFLSNNEVKKYKNVRIWLDNCAGI